MAAQAHTTPARRSAIMSMAHRLYRDDTNDRSFGDCLRAAWSWFKRLAATPLVQALRSGRSVTLNGGFMRSRPARAYVGGRSSAAYLSAVMGG